MHESTSRHFPLLIQLEYSDTDNALRRLTLFLEVLGTRPLPGSLDLISQLMDLSSQVMQSVSPAQADVSYIEQLLMSAIDNAADKVTVRC